MYVSMHARMHGFMDEWMHGCMCTCVHVCVFVCTYACMELYGNMFVCEYVCRFMLHDVPFISQFYWHLLTYILRVASRPTHVYIVIDAYMTYLDYIFYRTHMGRGADRTTCLPQKTLAL